MKREPGVQGGSMMKSQTVLITVGNEFLKSTLSRTLSGPDTRTVVKGDAMSTFQAAREIVPDLIILDLDRPGLDGRAVHEKLHEDELTRGIPVLFLTGADEREGCGAGAEDSIAKPFSLDVLLARAKGLLRGGLVPAAAV